MRLKIELGITNADIQGSRMAYPAERLNGSKFRITNADIQSSRMVYPAERMNGLNYILLNGALVTP